MEERLFYNALLDEPDDDEIKNDIEVDHEKKGIVSKEVLLDNCSSLEVGILSVYIFDQKIAVGFSGFNNRIIYLDNNANIAKLREGFDGFSIFFINENGLKEVIDIRKINDTKEKQWKQFIDLMTNFLEFKQSKPNTVQFQNYILSMLSEIKFYFCCQLTSRTDKQTQGLVSIENDKFKIQIGNNSNCYVIEKSVRHCSLTYEDGIVFYYSDNLRNTHFCLHCENVDQKNKVLKLFQQFVYQELENDEFVEEFLNFQKINNELVKDTEEEFDDDHSFFPKTGGIIFPLSSGKKRFSYHVGCGLSTEVLESWYGKNLQSDPPPHWRDHPKAKIVRQGYIEGDPIEEYRGDNKYKFKKQREFDPFPLSRPADYIPRRYDDYI